MVATTRDAYKVPETPCCFCGSFRNDHRWTQRRRVLTLRVMNIYIRNKVKVKVKVKCTLVQGLIPFHEHGTRRGWGVSVTPRPLFTSGKDPGPIAQEAGWVPGPVWTCAENLSPTGIQSPDRPARSQSLCRLRYQAHYIRSDICYFQYLQLSLLKYIIWYSNWGTDWTTEEMGFYSRQRCKFFIFSEVSTSALRNPWSKAAWAFCWSLIFL